MMTAQFCLVFLIGVSFLEAAKLPSYLVPCNKFDPKLNECVVKHGQEALPYITRGDPKYLIPNMTPLKIPEISFSSGDLKIRLENCEIHGMDKSKLLTANFDWRHNHIEVQVLIAKAYILADYDITGQILILPIAGHGPANITFVDGIYTYVFDYTLIKKNGDDYISVQEPKLTYTLKRAYYHFENLFNGDKRLGPEMNKFLNENWEEVSKDIGPALSETIGKIITAVVTGVFNKVPYKDIYLDGEITKD